MTIQRFQVLREHRWPSGLPRAIAVLRDPPDQISSRVGIAFHNDVDGLDALRQAYIQLPSGRVLVLRKHDQDPEPGTPVYSDVKDSPTEALEELVAALGLTTGDITWKP